MPKKLSLSLFFNSTMHSHHHTFPVCSCITLIPAPRPAATKESYRLFSDDKTTHFKFNITDIATFPSFSLSALLILTDI